MNKVCIFFFLWSLSNTFWILLIGEVTGAIFAHVGEKLLPSNQKAKLKKSLKFLFKNKKKSLKYVSQMCLKCISESHSNFLSKIKTSLKCVSNCHSNFFSQRCLKMPPKFLVLVQNTKSEQNVHFFLLMITVQHFLDTADGRSNGCMLCLHMWKTFTPKTKNVNFIFSKVSQNAT